MSDNIKHECGIALVRLLKPLEYYHRRYGTYFYGLNKLCLLMEKQHNRGQDGVGVATVKFDIEPGHPYVAIERSNAQNPIKDIFCCINRDISEKINGDNTTRADYVKWLKQQVPFCGELYLGHLRYGTFGCNGLEFCHPFIRENNWMTRTLILAGNFNLTNVDMLFRTLVGIGQHPVAYSDTVTILEKIGHFLDEENSMLYKKYRKDGCPREEITKLIAANLDIQNILKHACNKWDGGYVVSGLIGHGDAFIIRDPAGIRPAYYYKDDEVVVVASERPPIQTAFNVACSQVKEIPPGKVMIIRRNGDFSIKKFIKPLPRRSCSFERIYFSRGTDRDIYQERKRLGKLLVPEVLRAIDHDIVNTVFSYIPNTAETCFFGMIKELNSYCRKIQTQQLADAQNLTPEKITEILNFRPRFEKVAVKDAKIRTFITDDAQRNELAAHVYDITYGAVRPGKDALVIIDDSIVRGTTMRESILRILARTCPKKIVIVSSAPQIRYPDCYGIDMARLGVFVAFEAAMTLLHDTGREELINEIYEESRHQLKLPIDKMRNCVKRIYQPFSTEEITRKIAALLLPDNFAIPVEFIFQTIEGLHAACPEHAGDWYFTGDYPTPGGNKVVNQAFVNYVENNHRRAY